MPDDVLILRPIGFIRTEKKPLKFDARHQPDERQAETNRLELLPGDKYQKALKDLAGFEGASEGLRSRPKAEPANSRQMRVGLRMTSL